MARLYLDVRGNAVTLNACVVLIINYYFIFFQDNAFWQLIFQEQRLSFLQLIRPKIG